MINSLKRSLAKYFGYPLMRIYWKLCNPKSEGARALVLFDNQILLVKNLNLPYWTIPGGGIDKNETPESCVLRELYEELRLTNIKIDYQLGEYTSPQKGKRDKIFIYIVRADSLMFTKQWELADAKWFPLDTLPENLSPAVSRRIVEYKRGDRSIVSVW